MTLETTGTPLNIAIMQNTRREEARGAVKIAFALGGLCEMFDPLNKVSNEYSLDGQRLFGWTEKSCLQWTGFLIKENGKKQVFCRYRIKITVKKINLWMFCNGVEMNKKKICISTKKLS